ncbi:MAG: hypothetical protein WDN46_24125 [Methylocella sp.]
MTAIPTASSATDLASLAESAKVTPKKIAAGITSKIIAANAAKKEKAAAPNAKTVAKASEAEKPAPFITAKITITKPTPSDPIAALKLAIVLTQGSQREKFVTLLAKSLDAPVPATSLAAELGCEPKALNGVFRYLESRFDRADGFTLSRIEPKDGAPLAFQLAKKEKATA